MITEDNLSSFVSRIRTFIWLDAGHNNGERVMIWPTDENLISALTHFQIKTEAYVTPFQINSRNLYKRYHTEHYRKFSELLLCRSTNLSEYNNQTINRMFFTDESPSIDKHFELLAVF